MDRWIFSPAIIIIMFMRDLPNRQHGIQLPRCWRWYRFIHLGIFFYSVETSKSNL